MSRLSPLLRPRMIALHALAVVLVVVMGNLSAWQFGRLDDRRAFNDTVRARASSEPVPIRDVLTLSPEDAEWRPVIVRGRFRPADEVIVLNRSQNNAAGVDALTPFDFSVDATDYVVLVHRGFVPFTEEIPPPPPAVPELPADESEGVLREIQRVDVERLAGQVASADDRTVLPFYVDLLESPSITGGLPAPVANPDLSEGSHLSYAIQWIIFAICAAVAWFILVRRAIRSRPSA